LAGAEGSAIGQVISGQPLLCFSVNQIVVSAGGGALGGAFATAAVAGAELMSAVELSGWATSSLEAIGASISAVPDAATTFAGNRKSK
jgi:hypothetical protein